MSRSNPSSKRSPPALVPTGRHLQKLGLAILVIALLAGLALGAASAYRRAFAWALFSRGFEYANIEADAFTVEAFESTHVTLSGLTILRPLDLAIDRLEGRYSLSSLQAKRLESIDARGVRLRAQ